MGLLTGVRPAKLISSLLEEGKTDKECLSFLTEEYLVMPHKAALALKVAKAEQKILQNQPPRRNQPVYRDSLLPDQMLILLLYGISLASI